MNQPTLTIEEADAEVARLKTLPNFGLETPMYDGLPEEVKQFVEQPIDQATHEQKLAMLKAAGVLIDAEPGRIVQTPEGLVMSKAQAERLAKEIWWKTTLRTPEGLRTILAIAAASRMKPVTPRKKGRGRTKGDKSVTGKHFPL